jgi:hypothetical protein
MGFLKIKQPVLESGRALAPAQTLTVASTGTTITHYGVTIISSSASKIFRIQTPARAGEIKEIVFRHTAAAAKSVVRPLSTAQTFWNSTNGTITATSQQNSKTPASVRLISVASTGTYPLTWTIVSKSTAITIAG